MIQTQKRAEAELRIATAEAGVATLVEHEENLSIRVDALREMVRMSEKPSADLEIIYLELDRRKDLARNIADRIDKMRMAIDSFPLQITPLSYASAVKK